MDADEWVSAREATDILAVTGIPRSSLRRALNCGVAGAPIRTRGTLLYPRAAVDSLIQEPLTERTLPDPLDKGTFVARLRLGPSDPVRFPEHTDLLTRLESVAGGWPMSWSMRLVLTVRAERGVPMPLLATAGGFVVAGATIVNATALGGSSSAAQLTLGPAQEWYDDVRLRILRTPPGGPWVILPRDRLHHPWFGAPRAA